MQVTGHAPPRFALAVLLAAICGLLAGPAHADETFTFSGHGYGHGVGMPQYGAEGYALAGGTYQIDSASVADKMIQFEKGLK